MHKHACSAVDGQNVCVSVIISKALQSALSCLLIAAGDRLELYQRLNKAQCLNKVALESSLAAAVAQFITVTFGRPDSVLIYLPNGRAYWRSRPFVCRAEFKL